MWNEGAQKIGWAPFLRGPGPPSAIGRTSGMFQESSRRDTIRESGAFMRRRKFLALAGASVTWPLAAGSQQPAPVRRVGVLLPAAADDLRFQTLLGAFLQGLALLGWSEAQRNEALRQTMRTFYIGFRSQLAHAAKDWQRAGLIERNASIDSIAKAMMSLILGFVVQSAIMGDVSPASIGAGLRALSIQT